MCSLSSFYLFKSFNLTSILSTRVFLSSSFRAMSDPINHYSHAKTGNFIQSAPELHNPYVDDPILDKVLKRWIPDQIYQSIAIDLHRFGDRIVNEIDSICHECLRTEPQLIQYDAWGRRIDQLNTSSAWKQLKSIAAEEGLLAIGYEERKSGSCYHRLHQIAKLIMFSPSSALVTCPIAAGDGAAKAIEALNLHKNDDIVSEAFARLTSRNSNIAWTSGQWMTEKKGGSDVAAGCDTYAIKCSSSDNDNKYRLYGYKWFSSATDSEMALTLARVVDVNGATIAGSKGLSLFFVQLHDQRTKQLNGIEIVRLKNKLGSRCLPTAELLLDGAIGIKISDDGRGIAAISHMLNVTRIHNAMESVAKMRRMVLLARDYSKKRIVFGRVLSELLLHLATLSSMEIETRACQLLVLESARLLGLQESGMASSDDIHLLRLIAPIAKLYTAKKCMSVVSEGLECFGGQGYIEDTALPMMFRDAQITPIWEGTTNVLSLDVLRAIDANPQLLIAFKRHVNQLISTEQQLHSTQLKEIETMLASSMSNIERILSITKGDIDLSQGARDLAFAIAHTYAGALLTSHSLDSNASGADRIAAHRYCNEWKSNVCLDLFDRKRATIDRQLIFGQERTKASRI